ncbi:hypothetical protein [Phreatobacter stygius]|uniref:Transmembrane protein n=1 Tax=Phreatobacter stygius TaxID=1940610 RepID=A0A4D7BHA9_9HYPH|nr:hypothetical protein [Phreatobacter stygius]QCI68526.1 hypothetical protein E8M01_32440 [Phreatobacter stygius]
MTQTTAAVESPWSAVSWSAVFAGAVVAATASLSLLFLCAAIGLASVSPWSGQGVGGTALGVASGIGLILVQWISSGVGGFVTGRLRTRWANLHSDEVFFRDTANGLLTWCVATLIVAICLTSTISAITRTGVQATATVAAGAVGGVTDGQSGSSGDVTGYVVDTLFRGAAAAPANNADTRGEATRILVSAATSGEMPAADKTYLAQIVAQRAGIGQDEALRRVDAVLAKAQAAKVKAQETADKARKAASLGSLLVFLSLLIGAFIACVAAALGASYRDDVPLFE